MKALIHVVLLSLITSKDAEAYSTGAPTSVCSSLTPNHLLSSSSESLDFSITTSSSEYAPGGTINVFLQGSSDFKGFFLQAVNSDDSDQIVGTFSQTSGSSQLRGCTSSNDAVTHYNKELKNDITVTWIAPILGYTGTIRFRATFVQSFYQWRSNVYSSVLTAWIPTRAPSPAQPVAPPNQGDSNEWSWDCDFQHDLCGAQQSSDDSLDWVRNKGDTPSLDTGPAAAYSGNADDYYLHIEATGANYNDNATLILPSLPSAGQFCLTFAYHMYGWHINDLSIFTKEQDGTTKTVWMKQCHQKNGWIRTNVDFTVSANSQVLMRAARGNGYAADIAIDDVTLETGSCTETISPPNDLNQLDCNYTILP